MNARLNTIPTLVQEIRYGNLKEDIWRRDTAKGAVFNVSFQRHYKEGKEQKRPAASGSQIYPLLVSWLRDPSNRLPKRRMLSNDRIHRQLSR